MEDYSDLIKRLEGTLITYHNTEDNEWQIAKRAKDVTVWRKPSTEFNGFLYKAQGIVSDNPTRIMDYVRPGPCRLNWDSLMTSLDIVKTISEECCIVRHTTAGQMLNIISPREFVDFSYTTIFQDGLLSCGLSMDYEETKHNFVRGFNHPCGWFCMPTAEGPNQSNLSGYIQTDLRGMLPQTAVDNGMATGIVNFYTDLRRALKA
ncbi:stAR-related lipid transfer protein 4 isoform X2 [Denticeps clupeoides]|uniref:START domain-containing protein n=1 Tax=Denticeps clupeoides TaxID=299321 RepID=A0AAY4DWZ6_9TELE|nr:stAR-related lipid transfer protein 4 isoform X2 [Denticeps clupeoides]